MRAIELAAHGQTLEPDTRLLIHGTTAQIVQSDEQWQLLCEVAKEFFSPTERANPANERGPAFRELIEIMVERAEAALHRHQVSGFEGYQLDLYDFIATTCSTMAPEPEVALNDSNAHIFLLALNQYWVAERSFRWTSIWSPMPWSTMSRAEQTSVDG